MLVSPVDPADPIAGLFDVVVWWLGPRLPAYGVPEDALPMLPDALRRVYGFMGRWPGAPGSSEAVLPGQDMLFPVSRVQAAEAGLVAFASENQGNWRALVRVDGGDQQVWGEGLDLLYPGRPSREVIHPSLPHFRTTLVLHQLVHDHAHRPGGVSTDIHPAALSRVAAELGGGAPRTLWHGHYVEVDPDAPPMAPGATSTPPSHRFVQLGDGLLGYVVEAEDMAFVACKDAALAGRIAQLAATSW